MLNIYNSPQNSYFQARFLACARASTPYCFTQDDDYFIEPSIIRTMRARMAEAQTTSLHLLPPHEMLYSRLSTIRIDPTVHTLFAWLGYGTIMRRSEAQNFMYLFKALNATEDILKMADNYFTVLSNRLPELWFDQSHELGGGTPFTVGAAGEERNNHHIANAGSILDSLAITMGHSSRKDYHYVSLPTSSLYADTLIARAACSDISCVLETNIELLPPTVEDDISSASEIINYIRSRFDVLGTGTIEHYLQCSPSFAVDANSQTSFCSASNAKEDDWITLDWMVPTEEDLELVLLVDLSTEEILRNSRLESSINGQLWDKLMSPPKCSTTGEGFRECSIALMMSSPRKIRITLEINVTYGWRIHEMWLRRKG